METAINTPVYPVKGFIAPKVKFNIWQKYLSFADHQAGNQTLWYLVSLVFQGIFFLPIPAVLMFYYNAPIIVLPISFGLYLYSIIIGMGGSGIRIMISFFIISAIINIGMLAWYII